MKTKLLLFTVIVLSMICMPGKTAVITILSSGYTFVPDEVTIQPGDTVIFDLGPIHNAVEVSEETWLAGDTTSNGGFRLPLGGGTVTLTEVGTHYYVCQPHASLGMKGIIHVEIPNSLSGNHTIEELQLCAYPNPASDLLELSFNIENAGMIQVNLIDLSGRTISTLIDKEFAAGRYTESIPFGNIEPGHYILFVRTKSGTKAIPVVKL